MDLGTGALYTLFCIFIGYQLALSDMGRHR